MCSSKGTGNRVWRSVSSYLAEGFIPGKPVDLLGTGVPEGDPAVEVTDNNGIVGKFE